MPSPRFEVGNPGGPGRPKGSVSLTTILKQLIEAKDHAEAKAIVKNTITSAKLEDGQSRKMVWDRIDGPVVQKNENTNTQRLYFIKGEDADSIGADVE